jgi:chromosome segregation ATPase
VKIMKEHFRNVEQEVDHTNALFNAKHAEIQAESHLRQLASRALGRHQLESKKIQADIEKTQEQLNTVQSQIYSANENMDQFKLMMNWNQEDLEQWAVAAKQKEEDNLALQKYTRADEIKIKELTLLLEQTTKELLADKLRLEGEITETSAKQMELDRIAQEFKTNHAERQQLVEQWQSTIVEMKRRDQEIASLGERFSKAKADKAKKEEALITQKKRLSQQMDNNKEVEARSETLGRVVSKKREEMIAGQTRLRELRDELESLKNELTTAAESILTKRNENLHKSQMNNEKRVQLERERQHYQRVKQQMEAAKNKTMTVEQTAIQAEEELQRLEKEYSGQLSRVKAMKDKLFKEVQTVFDNKREEARMRADITGTKSTAHNMDAQLLQLDKEAARQQELLYNAEFQIQQIERKIARGMGERSDEEKRELRAGIEAAEKRLEEVKEKKKLLQAQSRRLLNELAQTNNKKNDMESERIVLREKQAELELENRMIEEEIRRETKDKEEITVQNDLLRLEVRRLRDLLSAKADSVYSLENRKQQLKLSMEERKQEILVHRDILKSELKAVNEEKHKLTMDLRSKEANVDKLKARFDTVARDTEQEGQSQSYYIILAAQKREELQRRGDELDAVIRKSEREIRALQLTLDHLNARNTAFRESFQKVDVKGEDVEILSQLEERLKLGKDALFRKKKEYQRLSTDFDEDNRRLEQVRAQAGEISKQKAHLENAKRQVEEEIMMQQNQMEEMGIKILKSSMKHRSKVADSTGIDVSNGTLEEKAVRAEVLKDVVQVSYLF